MDNKILDEYINYLITRKMMDYKTEYYSKRGKLFSSFFQPIIINRIFETYKKKQAPHYGYKPIEDNEYKIINNIFLENFIYYMTFIRKIYDDLSDTDHANINDFIQTRIIDNIKVYTDMKDFFIKCINDKETDYAEIYKNDNDSKIIVNHNFVQYKKIKIPLDNRLRYLLDKSGEKKFLRMILRYSGFGITGHHCSLPTNVYKYLYDEFNIRGEGFSSPLNSKLIQMKDTFFCTLFKDTDKYFGSKGQFSKKILIKNQNVNWLLNPPYMPDVMFMMYKKVMGAFKIIEREDFLVIILIPKWVDDKTYVKLINNKYLIRIVEPDIGKHYMNCNGRVTYMKAPVNSMFFLSKKKDIVSDEKIEKLIKVWNTFEKDVDNQSFFQEPIMI
jgi:hypothetical protein